MRRPKMLEGESMAGSFDCMLCKPALPPDLGPDGVKTEFVSWCSGPIDDESFEALKVRLKIDVIREQSGNLYFLRFPLIIRYRSQVVSISQRIQNAFNELVTGHLMAIQ